MIFGVHKSQNILLLYLEVITGIFVRCLVIATLNKMALLIARKRKAYE